MVHMALARHNSGFSLYTRPWFHKAFEVSVQRRLGKTGFNFCLRIKSKGDHPGLHFHIDLWGLLFEFDFHDVRHWDWANDRFYRPGEEAFEHLPDFTGEVA